MDSHTSLKSRLVYIAAGVILGWIICGLLLMLWVGFNLESPNSKEVARDYIEAVNQRDIEKAVALACPGSEEQVRQNALADIDLYEGISSHPMFLEGKAPGSDKNVTIVRIEFHYKPEGMDKSQRANMHITTNLQGKSRCIYYGN